jgi:predicted dinucleotide-binding enzyme
MDIAIIGVGSVGRTLGTAWARAGHTVTFGARDPKSEKAMGLLRSSSKVGNAAVTSVDDAATRGDVILLAVPWANALEAVKSIRGLAGKIIIDPINSFTPEMTLAVGFTTSVAEEISRAAPGAKVVKAFNTLGVDNVNNLKFGAETASGFICGDDKGAKARVAKLAEDVGFDVVDCGPLLSARVLEPLALLWGQLAFVQGLGPSIAFKLLRR